MSWLRTLRTARPAVLGLSAALTLFASPAVAAAQEGAAGPWRLQLRATISGSSHESAPAGYKLYSGLALEAGVLREIDDRFAVEISVRSESREASGPPADGDPLGSLELLPVSFMVQWRPRGATGGDFQPYVGAGGTLTTTWEKSGELDSADVSPQLDPTMQFGIDFALTRGVTLNADARWQTLGVTIDDYLPTSPEVSVDPLVLGLGLRVAP